MNHHGRPWGENPKTAGAWRRREDRIARTRRNADHDARRAPMPYRRDRTPPAVDPTDA